MHLEDEHQLEFVKDSAGPGKGAWFLGHFIYFKRTIKKSLIALDKTKRQLDKVLGFLSWFFIFAGWASLLIYLYLNYTKISSLGDIIFFWTKGDPFISIFLLSLWFNLYLFYKLSNRRRDAKRINYRFFKKTKKSSKRYNVSSALDEETELVLEDAYLLAEKLGAELDIIHFFRASLKNKKVQSLLIRLNVDAKRLIAMVDRQIIRASESGSGKGDKISPRLEKALLSAFVKSYYGKQAAVGVLEILIFACQYDETLTEILYELEIDGDKLENAVAWFRVDRLLHERYDSYRKLSLFKPGSGMNRAYTAIATPTLDHFSHDLTIKAKSGHYDLCVGRDRELDSIFENFSRGHNGILLVGDHGVGKTAIIGGLAQLMVAEDVPKFFRDKRLVEIDVSRLISGVGASLAQERLLTSINEASRSGNIILYIDNIESIIGITAGSDQSLDLSGVLAEAIRRGHIMCLASATSYNYAKYIENSFLGTTMTSLPVNEPDKNEAIQILQSKVGFLEARYDVYIVYSAIEMAVEMATRYLRDKALPLKAITLLEKAALIAAKNSQNNPDKPFCSKDDVAIAIEEMTGIPAGKVGVEEGEVLLNLEGKIKKRLVGQEEAVKAVSASLRRARVALKDKNRPIASFLFLGPTGVGKTELAKTVADIYFGSEDYMIRLDMSEYQHKDSVKKMIGSSDGTLGYLTEAVRKKPFSMILLDELEKADSNILNLFLQILDDGRLTDGQGKTVSFAESIIISTSNIGATFIQDSIAEKKDLSILRQELIDKYLREKMRPELINRFDGIIVFKPLTQHEIFQIATLMLRGIKKNLAQKGIGLKADKSGVMVLAKAGYDPIYGARPLRRLLQERVEDVVAGKILSQELKRRDVVLIDAKGGIVVQKGQDL